MITQKARLGALAVCTLSLPALAQIAVYEHPPAPEKLKFEPIEENPWFEQDENDPRFLRPAPGARERGIDRSYIQRMARPGVNPKAWQLLDEAGAPLAVQSIPTVSQLAPANMFAATTVQGNIIVLEGSDGMVVNTQQGPMFDHNGNGLQVAISSVLQRMGDNYDFVTVFTTFDDPGGAAYYLPLRQDVTGLGDCNFNSGDTFGCVFDQLGLQLQGFVFMNSVDFWRDWDFQYDGFVHDLSDFDASIYAVLGQEIGHRWGAGLRFVDPRTGGVSKQLLGRDNSHWAAFIDSEGSVMDGWDWDAEADGTFTLVNDMDRFSTLDLYAMGAQPVGSARPFFFIDDARFIPNQFVGNQPIPGDAVLQVPSVARMESFGITLRATGEKVDLTVQDIVDAEGLRCPDPDNTQKTFRQAIVLVTRPGQTAAQAASEIAELNQVMEVWEDWWKAKTDNALTLCTDLFAECAHAQVELRGGEVNGGELVERGSEFDLVVDVRASGDNVTGAVASVRLLGNGADNAELDISGTTISIGDITRNESANLSIPIVLDDEYPCGISLIAEVTLTSDNAQTVVEEYRIFPGYEALYSFDFDQGDDEFTTNDDGLDEFRSGGMSHTDIGLSCTMSPRTPERDASPGGKGAWVTGSAAELDGETSLWSGRLPLTDKGAVDPEIRFNFWLDAAPGKNAKLTVLTSETGDGFTEAKVYDEPFHGWILGRVRLLDVYEKVPEEIHVIFVFTGDGKVEGAIDDFTVLDRAGQCKADVGFCSCSSTGDGDASEPQFGFAALLGLAAMMFRRRRR